MATQQKKRKVKQYPEHPDYKFIVVGNPWPATKHGRDRDFKFYCTVTAWLEFMLGQKDLVQSIYSINTRDDIIVAVPKDTDILPILGAHDWNRFMQNKSRRGMSYIFEFNYTAKGDPATLVGSLLFPSRPLAREHHPLRKPMRPKTQPDNKEDVRVKSEPRDVQRDGRIPGNLRAAHNALLQERTEAQDRSRAVKQEYGIKQEDDQKPPRDSLHNFNSGRRPSDNVRTEHKVKYEPRGGSVPQDSLSSGVLKTLVTHGQLYKTDGEQQQPDAGPSTRTTDPRKARFGTKRAKQEEDSDDDTKRIKRA
ncbi:hypothetical protein NLI96_g7837 [Meripilus lineatus]|uniref:Uncharacterized protein n=1 Tax=Meripilus lineatus TaxID=2056292 RepID=A0AAD5UYG8_9APHY|nr:hypothetical protein NLI96_g7837 [Physisporinus lineatus]